MHNKENCSPRSNGGFGTNTATATCKMQSNGGVFESLYSALFTENASPPATGSNGGGCISLYPYEGNSGLKYTDSGNQSHPYDSCDIQKHQDMVNRQSMCLGRLVETSKEVEALRQENSQLRAVNRELQKQLNLVVQASLENQFGRSSYGQTMPFDVAQGFRGFHNGDNCGDLKENCADWNNNKDQQEVSDESPTSVIENNGVEVERFSLPKSISVRSNGYLKMAQSAAGASNASRPRGATRPRTSSTPPDVVQKVYVRGGKKEEEPLEMEVYNQGMFKTELCNKWQETDTCPYGDHCQFAHGIRELRPVIRHPRYKTEVAGWSLLGLYAHMAIDVISAMRLLKKRKL